MPGVYVCLMLMMIEECVELFSISICASKLWFSQPWLEWLIPFHLMPRLEALQWSSPSPCTCTHPHTHTHTLTPTPTPPHTPQVSVRCSAEGPRPRTKRQSPGVSLNTRAILVPPRAEMNQSAYCYHNLSTVLSSLPELLCGDGGSTNQNCWNGRAIGRYW